MLLTKKIRVFGENWKVEGKIDDRIIIYAVCIKIINILKFNNDSDLFAIEIKALKLLLIIFIKLFMLKMFI